MARTIAVSATNPHHYQQDEPAGRREFGAKLLPYAAQWVGTALTLPTALVAHKYWGTDPDALPWVTAGLSLTGAGLTYGTAVATRGRGNLQAHATLTTGAAAAWCTAATIAGPVSHPLIDMWLMGGAAVALSWNIRRMLGRGRKNTSGESAESAFWRSVKLAGTKTRGEIEVSPNKVVTQVQLPPGQLTADDVAKSRPQLASALSVGSNAVRVTPDPEHADRATITVVPQDMLKHSTLYPGPSSPAGSIAAPLIVGLYEDGGPVQLYLPGDKSVPRNATHVIVMGMNGSGKSHGAKLAWTEIATRSDVVLWIADPAKGVQTVGPIAPAVDWLATTKADAEAMIDALPDVIRERASWLGQRGHDQWVPGCGLPYLVVWIEEAAPVVRDSEAMIDIAQLARSAGISLVLSMQRPSYRNITTDVRQQLGAVWCFGVKSIEDAAFALSDDLIDAGANPAAWGNKKPGYAYLEAPGIDDDRMTSPLRTYAITDAEISALVAEYAPHRAQLDPTTAAAAGPAYANRKTGGTAMPAPRPPRAARDPFRGSLSDADDTPPALPANPEPDLNAGPDDELPNTPGSEISFGSTKPTLAQARDALTRRLVELQAAGATAVGPKDIGSEFFKAVRSRPWVSAELDRRALAGELEETDTVGVYRFPGASQAA